jgi:hypothetical protein
MQEYKVIIFEDGSEFWRNKEDQFHRDGDKPAIIHSDGAQFWYKNGKLHRDNGPAVIYANGTLRWYFNGELHREDDKPTVVTPKVMYWCIDGKLHRDNGEPAVIHADGTEEYWIDGVQQPNPVKVKELTVGDIEEILGYRVKIVKSKE